MRLTCGFLTLGLLLVAPVRTWAVGAVTAEVDQTLGLAALRQQTGLTGAGVKIGVVGYGIHDWEKYVPSGDLPGDIEILSGTGSGYTLGPMQVIHDVAPGAKLMFIQYGGGPYDDGVLELANAGADIILAMDDIWWTPVFEDTWTPYAQQVAQAGTLVIAATQDYGSAHYRATFTDAGNGEHDLGDGNTLIQVQIPPGCATGLTLSWSELFNNPEYDYRLRIYDENRNYLGELEEYSYYPMAVFDQAAPSTLLTFFAAVWKAAEAPSVPIDLRVDCYFPGPENGISPTFDPAYRVDKGGIVGVAALPEVLTVGALDQTTEVAAGKYAVRPYSARGPVEITIPATEVRPKPDIMAPDCQSRYVVPYEGTPYSYSQCSSSLSAAVVAGIAALLQEKQGFARTADIKALLANTASDLETPGYDYVTGYGQVDPAAALALPKVPVSLFWVAVLLLGLTVRSRRRPR